MRKDLGPVRERAQQLLSERIERGGPTTVQVVGSNGKGSVVHYLSELLGTDGSVVSFTSPHLLHPGERIKVNNVPLTERELDDALGSFGDGFLENYTPFEALFLVALRTALERASDFLVLEAGMGGRWDATSAIPAEWVILTSIDLEHTEYLGTDRRTILEEKLAQVPNHGKLITGFLENQDSQDGLDTMITNRNLTHVGLDEQAPADVSNRRQALLAARFLLDVPAEALSHRLEETGSPRGRQESFELRNRRVVLDVAHTPQAIEALIDHLNQNTSRENRYLLYGSLRGKKTRTILDRLSRAFDPSRTLLTEPNSPRAIEPDVLAEDWNNETNQPGTNPDPSEALENLLNRSEAGDLILVTGSFDLVGAIRDRYCQ